VKALRGEMGLSTHYRLGTVRIVVSEKLGMELGRGDSYK